MTRLIPAILALALCAPAVLPAQRARPRAVALTGPLPADPAVTIGTLPNGLRYYVRKNTRPEKRVLVWLAVKTGSVFEDDDQRGLAHLLEHMAFNGTKHFKPGELVSFFETAGARFGPHVNAYTSFDETVYMLQVPTDKEGLVDKGLLALADFAGGMSLDPTEIDKERGVVIEEWRLRQGASWRILEKQAPVLYYKSRYAERIPIGTPEILRSFPAARLKDFYETWYRPDRMAVVVVGDIDPAAMVPKVRELFAPLKPARAAAAEPNREVPAHAETFVNVAADAEAQATNVSVLHKRPQLSQGSAEDYRRDHVRQLMYQMLNLRFSEITQRPDAPFLGAGAGRRNWPRTRRPPRLAHAPPMAGSQRGSRRCCSRPGAPASSGSPTANWIARGGRCWPATSARTRNATRRKAPATRASTSAISSTASRSPASPTSSSSPRRCCPASPWPKSARPRASCWPTPAASCWRPHPKRPTSRCPPRPICAACWRRPATTTLTPWTETLSRTELLTSKPTAGKVTASRSIDAIGTTVLTLSNGAEVWLKPTDFKNDQVLLGAVARGGASTAPEAEYLETVLAASLVSLGGVGGLKPPEIGKILAGRLVGVGAFIDLSTQGVRGSSRPQDLETALQMLYLTFTAPNQDPQAMDLLKRQLSALVANRNQNPQAVFGDRLRALNTGNSYLVRPFTTESVSGLKQDVMARAYAARFANAADFSVPHRRHVRPGGHHAAHRAIHRRAAFERARASTTDKPLNFVFPAAVERLRVEQGKEPKSDTVITFFSDTGGKMDEETIANGAASLLQIRLRDLLREELGGTYSVSADYSNVLPSPGYGTSTISFGSSPENAEKLTAAVLAEVKRLATEGPTAEDAAKVREQEKRELETSLKQNGYWLGGLQTLITLAARPSAARLERRPHRDDHRPSASRRHIRSTTR